MWDFSRSAGHGLVCRIIYFMMSSGLKATRINETIQVLTLWYSQLSSGFMRLTNHCGVGLVAGFVYSIIHPFVIRMYQSTNFFFLPGSSLIYLRVYVSKNITASILLSLISWPHKINLLQCVFVRLKRDISKPMAYYDLITL